MDNETINTISEDTRSNKMLREMNELYNGYKNCRDTSEDIEVNTCVGKVLFKKIPYNVKFLGRDSGLYEYLSTLLSEGGVSVCISSKGSDSDADKIKKLEEENRKLRLTLITISGNDSTSTPEMLGTIARRALGFNSDKQSSSVITK